MTTRSGSSYKPFQPNEALAIRNEDIHISEQQIKVILRKLKEAEAETEQDHSITQDYIEMGLANLDTIFEHAVLTSNIHKWGNYVDYIMDSIEKLRSDSTKSQMARRFTTFLSHWLIRTHNHYAYRYREVQFRLKRIMDEHNNILTKLDQDIWRKVDANQISWEEANRIVIQTRAQMSICLMDTIDECDDECIYIHRAITYIMCD